MFTNKRLTDVYKNAKVELFDDHSKFIFFSDIHRGNDSMSDEFTRNQSILLHALDYYYELGYTYVEVGDGDELWEYRDFKTIRLAHGDIFTVLKKFYDDNRFLLIYGNHNIFLKNNNYVKMNYYRYYDEYAEEHHPLFPKLTPYEAVVLKEKNTSQEIFVVHGHQGDFLNDQLWPATMLLHRYLWRYFHLVGFSNPASPAKNLYKRHKLELKYRIWIKNHNKILICGHTHRPRFPKQKELPYFNTGCCIRTKGITGMEISNGKISMVDWRICSENNGVLKITRNIVRGPESISKYHRNSYNESL